MGQHQLGFADLPAEFPIFPLSGALLLPGGKLPLNIFEPRYLAMVEDALAGGRVLGMIQPDPAAAETGRGPGLLRVGCLGRLRSFSETDDGRYLITLHGLIRFGIAEELEIRRGYRRVRADYAGFAGDLDERPEPPPLQREELFTALRRYFSSRGFDANWDALREMPDDMLVATLCMACPFETMEKQALLEAATPAERAAVLLAVLRIDMHETDPGDPADGAVARRVS
ncbi:MAG: LON peptidase substrate-binding domain-containing protein [Acidisphaera sp.]|nr:LON peptidase substrate-binding domain-containing protein [Acidisphaera sp.]